MDLSNFVTVKQFAEDMGIDYQVARLRFRRGEVTGFQLAKHSTIMIEKTVENGYAPEQLEE